MDNPFAAPAPPASGIKWENLNGRLLLIEPKAIEAGIATNFGDADAVKADVAVLDGDDKGTEYKDSLVFPKVLQSQLRQQIGLKVLGRLGQGTPKPGQSPPWILQDATPDDQQTGIKFLEWRKQNTLAAPAPAAQPEPAPSGNGSSVPF